MTYTEIKTRNNIKYFYRCRSKRVGEKYKKERVYLGKNLSSKKLKELEKKADEKFGDHKNIKWPYNDKSFFYYASTITPHLNIGVIQGLSKLKKKYPEYTLDWFFTYYSNEGDESGWIESQDDQEKKASILLKNTRILKEIMKQWKDWLRKYYRIVKRLEENGIRNLKKDYSNFTKNYIEEYGKALIIESFYMGHERIINRLIEKYPNKKQESHLR
ncbi:MAG: hypothetical protein ISS25_04475 [Nanoarchaeota archaeon]|nr:hypothetical protein [DPANN group archaeon]MBL7117057.1 hypothetical protein [Nanoarchaeota archaeon]